VENHVTDVLANVDVADESLEDTGKEEFYTVGMKRGKFQARLINVAKVEFGLLQRTESNRLMVRKFLRDYMREHGMRPTHIVQHLDVSTACFFIPSGQDILAHQLGASREAITREGMINTIWESAYGAIGRMLSFRKE
jgi:hypothetical protein